MIWPSLMSVSHRYRTRQDWMLHQHTANGNASTQVIQPIQLPQELILSINNILNLNKNKEHTDHDDAEGYKDPLDVIDNDFSPIDILNTLFPNGLYPSENHCASSWADAK